MRDAFAQLLSYLLGIWRHRWLGLVLAWILALAGWAFVAQMPESYVARARVFVDTNSVLGPLMRGLTVNPNINERIAMMSRTLLSRPNLEKLGRMTDLDLQVSTEVQREGMIKRLEESITLGGVRGNDTLYSITVTDPSRETARRIAEALITVFIETSMSDKRLDSSGAQDFLNQQIAESEKRLVAAETRLAEFKKANIDVLPGESGDYYDRLQLARRDLEQVKLQLRELDNRRAELQRQLDGEDPVFITGESLGSTNYNADSRIRTLQAQLDSLLTHYTEKHPDIRRLRGMIGELEAERQAEYDKARLDPGAAFNAMSTSPVYQGMRSMLAETQALAAELEVRAEEYEARVHALDTKVNQIPDIEAQLKQLNRDYVVISQQHQQMLERRESARLSGDVERNANDVTFRVIDPPFVPRQPSYPNKPLLNAGVLLFAMGGGGAAALLVSLLYPIVTDARMLAQSTGLPLLGTVSFHRSIGEARAQHWRLAGFITCLCALLVMFAAVIVLPESVPWPF